MPRRHRKDFTSDSESGDSKVDPFEEHPEREFICPTPVSCSDIEEPSPSQYRKEMAMEEADEPISTK